MAARRVYSEEFKREAVQRWLESGQSATSIEEELGISRGSLSKWQQTLGSDPTFGVGGGEPPEELTPTDEPAQGEPDVEKETVELAAAPEVGEPVQAEVAGPEAEAGLEPKVEKAGSGRGVRITKRIAGIIAVLLGGLGILLAVALLIGAWLVNTPVTDSVLQLLESIEVGLVAADAGLDQVDAALTTVNQKLADTAAMFTGEELLQVVNDAQAIVEVVQSTAETAVTMLDAINSLPLIGRNAAPADLPKLEEALLILTEISDRLAAVEQRLIDRQTTGGSGPLVQLQTDISQLQDRLANASAGVAEATASVQQLRGNVPGWIDWISIALTLLFLWLGVAQYSLLVNGLGWLRRP